MPVDIFRLLPAGCRIESDYLRHDAPPLNLTRTEQIIVRPQRDQGQENSRNRLGSNDLAELGHPTVGIAKVPQANTSVISPAATLLRNSSMSILRSTDCEACASGQLQQRIPGDTGQQRTGRLGVTSRAEPPMPNTKNGSCHPSLRCSAARRRPAIPLGHSRSPRPAPGPATTPRNCPRIWPAPVPPGHARTYSVGSHTYLRPYIFTTVPGLGCARPPSVARDGYGGVIGVGRGHRARRASPNGPLGFLGMRSHDAHHPVA